MPRTTDDILVAAAELLRRQARARVVRAQRELAAALAAERQADADVAELMGEPPPLTGTAADAAEFVRTHPRATGEEIAAGIGIAFQTFRNTIAGKLRRHGIVSHGFNGGGYRHVTRPA